MVRALAERSQADVAIRILGRAKLPARRLNAMRLHTRAIVRDGTSVFVGSQSLRRAELDMRREIGVLVRDETIAGRLAKIFSQDWDAAQPRDDAAPDEAIPTRKIAKKVAKAVLKELPPVSDALEVAVKEVAGDGVEISVNSNHLQEAVQDAVKHAVKAAVRDVVEDTSPPRPKNSPD